MKEKEQLTLQKYKGLLEGKGGREKVREENISVKEKHRLVASPTHPNQGPKLQPRHVP